MWNWGFIVNGCEGALVGDKNVLKPNCVDGCKAL